MGNPMTTVNDGRAATPEPTPGASGATRAVEDAFIRQWGDMGAIWGINRTMAEIHGLLYITGQTLSVEAIMERLGVSRGNCSMSLRGLLEWGIVRKVHRRGDRKDYFESLADVGDIITRVVQQRKRREIDPILHTLRDCQERLDAEPAASDEQSAICRDRLGAMLSVLSMMEALARRFTHADGALTEAVERLADGG